MASAWGMTPALQLADHHRAGDHRQARGRRSPPGLREPGPRGGVVVARASSTCSTSSRRSSRAIRRPACSPGRTPTGGSSRAARPSCARRGRRPARPSAGWGPLRRSAAGPPSTSRGQRHPNGGLIGGDGVQRRGLARRDPRPPPGGDVLRDRVAQRLDEHAAGGVERGGGGQRRVPDAGRREDLRRQPVRPSWTPPR